MALDYKAGDWVTRELQYWYTGIWEGACSRHGHSFRGVFRVRRVAWNGVWLEGFDVSFGTENFEKVVFTSTKTLKDFKSWL